MKTRVFSVYDSAAKCYSHPFYVPREEQALRAFTDATNSPNHEFGKHPADYTLFLLGEFDDADGTYTPHHPAAKALATGLSVLIRPAGDPAQLPLTDTKETV